MFCDRHGELYGIRKNDSRDIFTKADTMNRGKVTFLDIQLATNNKYDS